MLRFLRRRPRNWFIALGALVFYLIILIPYAFFFSCGFAYVYYHTGILKRRPLPMPKFTLWYNGAPVRSVALLFGFVEPFLRGAFAAEAFVEGARPSKLAYASALVVSLSFRLLVGAPLTAFRRATDVCDALSVLEDEGVTDEDSACDLLIECMLLIAQNRFHR